MTSPIANAHNTQLISVIDKLLKNMEVPVSRRRKPGFLKIYIQP